MPPDLDLNDLDEVRRRVVNPVLAAMLRPGELVSAELVSAQDWPDTDNEDWAWKRWPNNPDADRPGDEPNDLYLVLRAVEDEQHLAWLGSHGFSLHDVQEIAERLESNLNDWICETRFGWGQSRGLGDVEFPAAPPDSDGRPIVGLWVGAEGAELTVDWAPVDLGTLGLSDTLVAEIRRWQGRIRDLAAAEAAENQAKYEAAMSAPGSGFTVSYIDASRAAEELAAARAARQQAHLGRWRQLVAELEPWRDDILTRLQAELGDAYAVPLPPRIL